MFLQYFCNENAAKSFLWLYYSKKTAFTAFCSIFIVEHIFVVNCEDVFYDYNIEKTLSQYSHSENIAKMFFYNYIIEKKHFHNIFVNTAKMFFL